MAGPEKLHREQAAQIAVGSGHKNSHRISLLWFGFSFKDKMAALIWMP